MSKGPLERLVLRRDAVADIRRFADEFAEAVIAGARALKTRDPQGRLLGYEGLVEDITESRRARSELEESNQFREEIISGASEGIVVYDRALRHIVWNRYMEELTGIPAERALGGRAFDMAPGSHTTNLAPPPTRSSTWADPP